MPISLAHPPDVSSLVTLLLVDDDTTFLRHVERFLGRKGAFRIVGTATRVPEAVSKAGLLAPDIVLLDLSLPGTDGFEAIGPICRAAPGAAVIVVTMLEDDSYRERALSLGASAYVLKRELVDTLVPEIERLAQSRGAGLPGSAEPPAGGRPPVPPEMADTLLPPAFPERVTTGVIGLDEILRGGVPTGESYLIQGGPGTGKTTIGLQFLRAAVEQGEPTLYVTLSQTVRSLTSIAQSHGWRLDGIVIRECGDADAVSQMQTVFPSAEVELEETMMLIREAVDDVRPTRVVVDTVSDLRALAGDQGRYRREIRDLRRFFAARGCTVVFLDDMPDTTGDHEFQNQANGILHLQQDAPDYGGVRRTLQVVKMRSTPFLTGCHNFRIHTGGVMVYPRVTADGHSRTDTWEPVPSGVPSLDEMLHGGLREGTACLIAGPTGSGKSAVAFQYAHASASRGEPAAVFLFNERLETFYMRSKGLGMAMEEYVRAGLLHVQQVDTGVIAPSEFAQRVRQVVEGIGARVIVVDSLSGYVNSMLRQKLLAAQLHELVTYLSQHGVLTLLVADQQSAFTGGDQVGPTHVSYLADSVLLLSYLRTDGVRQRTITVLKQRHGPHARDARELHLSAQGVAVGDPIASAEGLTLDPFLLATLYPAGGSFDGHTAPPPARA